MLETLAALIRADSHTAAQWELHITQPMLHIWAAHVNDPMLVLDTMDIFEALAAIPTALPNLQVDKASLQKLFEHMAGPAIMWRGNITWDINVAGTGPSIACQHSRQA